MPRNKIIKEMRPAGSLRESIKELMQENGAYIIASSQASATEAALKNRRKAMKEAVADETGHENLHLDFFDRGRIASWVSNHPTLILWVRDKIGKPLTGWRAHGNWTHAPDRIKEEYLFDDELRLHDGDAPGDKRLSVAAGFSRLRDKLSTPRTCVRLVGLSGVGKTRLVQALFDDRVGKDALNPSLAIYTDVSDSPDPVPVELANQLIGAQTRAILIIDNCSPDLHRRLVQICSDQQSDVSLLTIEYDVQDDIPEETSVFRLERASDNIIEKLISKRYGYISQVDARTIATFSGGNARMAIALANTVRQGETVSGFRNDQLFKKLFWQRHDPHEGLLISAQAFSLVYSFEGTDTSSDNSEIKFLARLVDKSPAELFRDIAELRQRDLIQSRGVWRAILPHAIANRLAGRALESIPKDTLVCGFIGSSERLMKSFSRRLGYLHDCGTAVEIVNDWLNQDGWIGKSIDGLNSFGIIVLKNIAPVSPVKTLEAIERAANGNDGSQFTSRKNPHFIEFVRLLRHLAYEPELFDRSVELLCRYALSEDKDENNNSIRDVLKSLFYLYLSGTHTPIEARVKVIEKLIDSEDPDKQELGFLLLDAALEAWHCGAPYEFDFGARSRDYGYHPNTRKEIMHWFDTAIGICTRIALSGGPISGRARELLTKQLRGLWTNAGMHEALEESARKILEQGVWTDGWIAVCGIIRFDSKSFNDEVRARLYKLERLLKPVSLLDKARTFALSEQRGHFDLEDVFDEEEDACAGYRRAEETTRRLGAEVANNAETLNVLLPELVSSSNVRLRNFGIGLAEGTRDKTALFKAMHDALGKTPPEQRKFGVIRGFLSYCADSDPSFYNSTLDTLIKDELLGDWFPYFQVTSNVDQRGVERLHEALDLGVAQIPSFQDLAYRRAHESISDDDLAGLLEKIHLREGGADVALDVLFYRFNTKEKESFKYSARLIAVARDVMTAFSFDDKQSKLRSPDHKLAEVANICLNGTNGNQAASIFCQNFAKVMSENRIFSYDFPRLLNKLATMQPTVFLDTFLGGDRNEDHVLRRLFSDDFKPHGSPVNQITDKDILSWCEQDPSSRYPLVASTVKAFKQSDETGKYEWKPFVYTIFDKAPVLEVALERFADALIPTGGSGSRADILEKHAVLYENLYGHDNSEIAAWAENQYRELQELIRIERDRENQQDRERYESFE